MKGLQIAALPFSEQVEAKDSEVLEKLGEGEREAVDWLIHEHGSGLSEPIHPPSSDFIDTLELGVVILEAAASTSERVNVVIILQGQS